MDLSVLKSSKGAFTKQTGYFVMISGELDFYIWVSERSHLLQHTDAWKINRVQVKKLFVPAI